jgi:hypothetical protein
MSIPKFVPTTLFPPLMFLLRVGGGLCPAMSPLNAIAHPIFCDSISDGPQKIMAMRLR